MWFLQHRQYWFLWISHSSRGFSNTSNFKTDWRASWSPIKAAEWGIFLRCLAHWSPLSIRQCRTPNKCPHPAVSHCRRLEQMSDNLTSAMKCLHQIINTFIDRSQRVLREPFVYSNYLLQGWNLNSFLSVYLETDYVFFFNQFILRTA